VSFHVLLLYARANQYRAALSGEANMGSESPVMRVCL